MPAKLLMTQAEIDEHPAEWLDRRSDTLGASEVGQAMGIAPKSHGTPFSLYVEKLTGERIETGGDEDKERGVALEPLVVEKLARNRPDLAILPGGLYADENCPWMTATFDRFAIARELLPGGKLPEAHPAYDASSSFMGDLDPEMAALLVPVEVKTAIGRDFDPDPAYHWGEPYTDQVPVHYKAQAYWQMCIWGCDRVLMPVRFMTSWQDALYVIQRTEDAQADIEFMVKEGRDFLDRLGRQDPPELDWAKATAAALRTLNPMREGSVYQATANDARLLRGAYLRMKEAERKYRLRQNKLAARAGGAQKIVVPDPLKPGKDVTVMSRRQGTMTTIDDGRFRTEEPEIARRYERVTELDSWYPGQRWMKLPPQAKNSVPAVAATEDGEGL
jgi:putative phage-type endonuclease